MCSVCETNQASGYPADTLEAPSGAVAQLVEHLHGMQGVRGSIPLSSTDLVGNIHRMWRSIGFTLAGFVAGEGWFIAKRRTERFVRDGSPRLSFVFGVTVAQRDRNLLEALTAFLGVGTIRDKPARLHHHQPLSEFTIASHASPPHRDHPVRRALPAAVPQARPVRARGVEAIAEYEKSRTRRSTGRGRSTCSIPGCDEADSWPQSLSQPLLPCHRLLKTSAAFLGGFVAAEGTLLHAPVRRRGFAFAVGLGRIRCRNVSETARVPPPVRERLQRFAAAQAAL